MTGDMQVVPIGWKDGIMIVKGWRLPSCIPVMIKSKDYMIDGGPKLVSGASV